MMERNAWSKDDIKRMTSMVKAGEPARAIASTLGRSEGAVRQKLFSLGVGMKQTKKRTSSTRKPATKRAAASVRKLATKRAAVSRKSRTVSA